MKKGTGSDRRWLYFVAFPAGHGAVDWGGGAYWVLAPAIALHMGLSPAGVGLLFALTYISRLNPEIISACGKASTPAFEQSSDRTLQP